MLLLDMYGVLLPQVPVAVVEEVTASIAAPTASLYDQVQWSILVCTHSLHDTL
jgi:hypothetical protein